MTTRFGDPFFPTVLLIRAAWISGIFCLIVAGLLIWNHQRVSTGEMRQSQTLAHLKAGLRKQPQDEALKQRIRAADSELRRQFFQKQAAARRGAWLLAGGLVLLIVSARTAAARARAQALPAFLAVAPAAPHMA